MADAKKNPVIKPQDMHATGGETTNGDMHATGSPLQAKDMHATGGDTTNGDMHATSEPAH
ncbi:MULTISPECIES: hypothetical protein [Streptomyces]|uniref:Sigma-like protein n=1 Tax=Streptomyces rhizosphaericola TaxID=2564098 RepID=A0ABY2PN45_9ACTN|nr:MULTISPECIES: hypothetical protein [Streptomyces]ARI52928.1 hypothetical protein A6E92_12510 [Streptomyces sp. S8]MYT40205.1 hypothetical protein [Streptomyces sp. SID8356]MYT91609.1 hypothetical protein [Streptomyces sp. SID8359]MYT95945.1 hypothetical protein [Streptomyces sp. SID8350]NGO86290.1 hypothetical protein [Streptomyces sp. 196(2019)]